MIRSERLDHSRHLFNLVKRLKEVKSLGFRAQTIVCARSEVFKVIGVHTWSIIICAFYKRRDSETDRGADYHAALICTTPSLPRL
jgi:hypothetical protein